jgi:hypothetical protein
MEIYEKKTFFNMIKKIVMKYKNVSFNLLNINKNNSILHNKYLIEAKQQINEYSKYYSII